MKTTTPYSEIGLLCLTDPEAARALVLEAFRAAGMHRGQAAKKLGVNIKTLRRTVERLKLARAVEQLEKQAVREGWKHEEKGGWPLGKSRAGQPVGRKKRVA